MGGGGIFTACSQGEQAGGKDGLSAAAHSQVNVDTSERASDACVVGYRRAADGHRTFTGSFRSAADEQLSARVGNMSNGFETVTLLHRLPSHARLACCGNGSLVSERIVSRVGDRACQGN